MRIIGLNQQTSKRILNRPRCMHKVFWVWKPPPYIVLIFASVNAIFKYDHSNSLIQIFNLDVSVSFGVKIIQITCCNVLLSTNERWWEQAMRAKCFQKLCSKLNTVPTCFLPPVLEVRPPNRLFPPHPMPLRSGLDFWAKGQRNKWHKF